MTTVSDTAGLIAALKAAQPGEVILLNPGVYGTIGLRDLNFSTTVTVQSADPAAPAVLTHLDLRTSSGLTFRNLEFFINPAGTGYQFNISGCSAMRFDGLYVHGSLDGSAADDKYGPLIRGSRDVVVSNSTFEQLYWGVAHLDVTGFTVRDSRFHDIRSDGVRGGGSSDVLVTGNRFWNFQLQTGDHGDAIQFWTKNTTASARNIRVEANVFERLQGDAVQGVFFRDEEHAQRAITGLTGIYPFAEVTVRDNLMLGGIYNGIAILGGRGVDIAGNMVQGFVGQKSWIRLDDVDGGILNGNAANNFLTNGPTVTNIVETGSLVVPLSDDQGIALAARWRAIHEDGGVARYGSVGPDTLVGAAGADTIVEVGGANYLRGAEGADTIVGGGGFDDINGNTGTDTANGGPGDDWVVGGQDNDSLADDAGADLVYGNKGDDICDGGPGGDIVRGGQGDDVVRGGAGTDFVSGDTGTDTVSGGEGADSFHTFGEAGVDRVTDFSAAEGDRVQLDPGTLYVVEQVGADTVVRMVGGGEMILVGVQMSTLPPGWIFGA